MQTDYRINPNTEQQIAKLRNTLARRLPGLPVQMGMSPAPRPGTERILDPHLDCRRAGVLVLLYPHDAGAPLHLVLTRRSNSVESHRGQISFPGGSMEPGEDAIGAALREAQEELEVDPASLTLLGQLSPLYIPPSDFCVYPVVAYAAARPAFVPSPHEVAEVLEVPLAHLLSPATRCEEVWDIRGAPVRVPYYAFGEHKVWGATAMVLCEFLALLTGAADGLPTPGSIASAHDPRV
jgi:8-oxo-dGTP pyrophosphatase MutT (NUDIX family)